MNRAEPLQIPLEEVTRLIETKVASCFDQADDFFKGRFRRPTVSLKQRGRAAGTAYLHTNQVRFNLFMFQQSPEKFLAEVVPHEVAHIIVYQIYGSGVSPHGQEWRAVMKKVFDLTPARTHDFDVPPPKQSFTYQCGCQTHLFTKRRHNYALQGRQYICKKCKQPLVQLTESQNRSA
ncbi:SprT family zinc-dependent metalloprotease [Marinomonas epiphytica]